MESGRGHIRFRPSVLLVLPPALLAALPAHAQSLDRIGEVSIEDLGRITVTSVSKTDEPLSQAPAAIYVIGHEAIVNSAAATLPEILRLAPNLQVYQQAPGKWVVSARGMNGNLAAQSFSNKLLVLVDGRTVYTPLFSGVYWDLPDVLPADIDRIEVISGPGSVLWGANAVNGVINVITRNSALGAGLVADVRVGASRSAAGIRYGQAGDTLSWRAGVRLLDEGAGARTDKGASAGDPYHRLGGQVRIDWTPGKADTISLLGELFGGRIGPPDQQHERTSGRNVTLRWERKRENDDTLEVQAFYDRIARDSRPTGGRFFADTWDIDLHDSLHVGRRNLLVWGGGVRLTHYRIDGTAGLAFDPPSQSLALADAFVEDSLSLTQRLNVRAGVKVEKDPFLPAALLPEVRVAWQPSGRTLLWGAVSRAIRSATPFDTDVQERAGIVSLNGNRAFRSEKLAAYELGLRLQPVRTLSVSLTGFVHDYSDLRTVEVVPGPGFSLSWGNNLAGPQHGLDGWFDWSPTPWWTLSGGVTLLRSSLHFVPGASGIIGPGQAGTDPGHQFKLSSTLRLPARARLDLAFRAVGALQGTPVPGYRELDTRLALPIAGLMTIGISATNLLHVRHLEYPGGDYIPRRVMAALDLQL